MRLLRRAAAAVVAVVAAIAGLSIYYANEVTHVDRNPVTRSALVLSSSTEAVAFVTSDGLTLHGWFVPVSTDRAAVIVHGKDGNRVAGDHTLRVARWLRDAGYSLLLFDMRGHGESEGDRFSLGLNERKDVAAAVDLLVRRGFRMGRIALVGESMGAAVVIQAVALRPDVAAVVADSAYGAGRAVVSESGAALTGLPDWTAGPVLLAARLVFGLDLDAVDPVAVVRRHPERAFLFIACDDDTVVRPHHSRDLREASADPDSRLWVAAGCGHVGASERYGDEYRARVIGFLDGQLR